MSGGEESFLDVLKSVAKIGSGVLPVAGSMLGPIGGLVGTAAGALLGAVSEAAIMGPEGTFVDNSLVNRGTAERAMLAEASLQAVLSLPSSAETRAIIDHMDKIWKDNAPNVDALAKVLTPQLTECGLTLALDRLARPPNPSSGHGQESTLDRRPLEIESFESTSGQQTAFIEGLFGPTVPEAMEEGAFSWLGPMLSKAVTLAKPLVSQAAKAAINELGPKLIDKVVGSIGSGSESVLTQAGLQGREPEVRLLLKRALVADTALQALMALPKSKLDTLLVSSGIEDESEGIFDSIKGVVQKYGPTVLSVAKDAVKTYAPVVIKLVADHLSESSPGPLKVPSYNGSGDSNGLRKQRSILDLIAGDNVSHSPNEEIKESIEEEQDFLISVRDAMRSGRTLAMSTELPTYTDANDDRMPICSITPPNFSP